MKTDATIDGFVRVAGTLCVEPGWGEEIPEALRTAGPDGLGCFAWQFKRVRLALIAALEVTLDRRFPLVPVVGDPLPVRAVRVRADQFLRQFWPGSPG